MRKVVIGSLMVVVLLFGVGLYLGQTRGVNASTILSMDEMGMIKAGRWFEICRSDGSTCPSAVNANAYCSAKFSQTYIHAGETVTWCDSGGGGSGASCGGFGLKCTNDPASSCGSGTSATCSGINGQPESPEPTSNCGSLSRCH